MKKNNKGFALAEILAVTLVMMAIFAVLYGNFMPLAGEYDKSVTYNDVSSQYTLHYFRKLFMNNVTLNSNEEYRLLNCSESTNQSKCNELLELYKYVEPDNPEVEVQPKILLTKYNLTNLKTLTNQEYENIPDELKDFSNYINNLPNYKDKDGQVEVYRLMIKTQTGYATVALNIKTGNSSGGVNPPKLLDNMIPVYYDETCNNNAGCWEKADSTNINETYKWYDHDEKMWANAVTVDAANRQTYKGAPEGTEIPMSEINSMWVWIPRYTYTYFNDNTNTPKEIQIQFEEGTASSGTITCTDNVRGLVDGIEQTTSQTCTDSNTTSLVPGTSTYTHPAFDFGDTPLTGFWIGKFENSATSIPSNPSTLTHTLIIKPNEISLRYKAISYQFKDVRQMEKYENIYGFEQPNSTTFTWTGELTGDTNNLDTHMLKNIEWGAVAYLSHSKYGKNSEIGMNSANTYTTGCGPQSKLSVSSGTTCKEYNTDLGQLASTTGNVYGIYDMSGGTNEYVMGNMVDLSGVFYPSKAGQWSSTTKPLVQYYDSYTYNTTVTNYTRGRLGDATVEMAPTGLTGNWYSDYAYFPSSLNSWFIRGCGYNGGTDTGVFCFSYFDGDAYSYFSSHSALIVLD